MQNLERHRRARAPDIQTRRRPVSRDSGVERSETELERETGVEAPSTKVSVEFTYRLG
jgi:hypothetical protein